MIPKGFLPQQDNGLLMGGLSADQSTSFQLMQKKVTQFLEILREDPAVKTVSGSTDGHGSFAFAVLKPRSERRVSTQQVMERLRLKTDENEITGAGAWLAGVQDLDPGEHWSPHQYTLRSDNIEDILAWAPKVEAALNNLRLLHRIYLDQPQHGLETDLIIDRDTAARLGLTISQIDNTLYDAFGERQVSTIYAAQNQYHVVTEVAPEFWQNPETLIQIYVGTSGGPVSGVQATQPLAGTVLAKEPAQRSADGAVARTTQITGDSARNLAKYDR
jgi:multidrug efflux pump